MIRLLLVVLCLLLLGAVLGAMRAGWRHRAARQTALARLPDVPDDLGPPILAPASGLYVGTTSTESWQDRVVAGGLGRRAAATASLSAGGLVIDRVGEPRLFLPAASLRAARLAPGLAGHVVGAGGLLVVRWQLGDVLVDTGFRADDKTRYPEWVRSISGLVVA